MLGKLVATSIIQGGRGFPVLLPAAYSYICKEEYLGNLGETPDPLVSSLLEQVRIVFLHPFVLS